MLMNAGNLRKKSTRKISSTISSLTEKAIIGVLSLTNKVDKKAAVPDVLHEKQPEPCKVNLSYLVCNYHSRFLPNHQFTFEKLNASLVIKSAMKTHGNHEPSD